MDIETKVTITESLPEVVKWLEIVVTQDGDSTPFMLKIGEDLDLWVGDEDLRRLKNAINAARRARRQIT